MKKYKIQHLIMDLINYYIEYKSLQKRENTGKIFTKHSGDHGPQVVCSSNANSLGYLHK